VESVVDSQFQALDPISKMLVFIFCVCVGGEEEEEEKEEEKEEEEEEKKEKKKKKEEEKKKKKQKKNCTTSFYGLKCSPSCQIQIRNHVFMFYLYVNKYVA